MKVITQGFEDALKTVKKIDAIISFSDRDNTNYIITQNSEFLITQVQDFLVTESAEVVINNNGIQNVSIYWNSDLLKSSCKMLDLETSTAIPKGTELNVKIGIMVDGDYEYIDYGKFYTIEESKKQLDTGTYTTTAYDNMIKFNIKASENPLTFEEGVTYNLKQYLEMICEKCGVPYNLNALNDNANADINIINSDLYENKKSATYRDIIDDIAECLGTNFIINIDNRFTIKDLITTSVMTIDADNLKDSSANIGEKKDPIDGIQVYDNNVILNYTGDCVSPLIISNNNIMSAYNSQLINNVFSKVRDFTYYTFEIDTFGILALEAYDCFTLSYRNTNYLLCSLHNDITTNGGLDETISYEFNKNDDIEEYSFATEEEELKDAYIEIDKANSQIVLKANSNGKIVKAELDADADEGSTFNVEADNINFTGKTFNLTADNMAITSTNFSVDKNGNMTANSGTFGGTLNTSQNCTVGNNLYVGQNQSSSSVDNKYIYFDGNQYIRRYLSGSVNGLDIKGDRVVHILSGTSDLEVYRDSIELKLNNSNEIYVENGYIQFARQPVISSDKKLKEKIKDIDVSWVDELKVKEYEYKNTRGKKQIGLIAQDYIDKDYAKYFVEKDKNETYGIQYGNITNALIKYCQELKKEVLELKEEVKELKNEK